MLSYRGLAQFFYNSKSLRQLRAVLFAPALCEDEIWQKRGEMLIFAAKFYSLVNSKI